MAPWCADGEMPTCANLNLYGGSGSRVRWHSDNEGLFGRQGESKLIVSMSFGVSALFKWKPGPSLDSDASSSWLHHGVMDGSCQGEYLHCTDPLRVNITFRWIRKLVPRCPLAAGVVCCLPTCAKGSLVSSNTDLILPGLLSVVLLALLGWFFSFWLPSAHLGWNCVARPCAATGFPVGCGVGLVDAVLDRTLGVRNSVGYILGINWLFWMRSTLVRIGLPSLLNNDAYFVFWITGAPCGNGRIMNSKTLFLPFLFFGLLVSRISFF